MGEFHWSARLERQFQGTEGKQSSPEGGGRTAVGLYRGFVLFPLKVEAETGLNLCRYRCALRTGLGLRHGGRFQPRSEVHGEMLRLNGNDIGATLRTRSPKTQLQAFGLQFRVLG